MHRKSWLQAICGKHLPKWGVDGKKINLYLSIAKSTVCVGGNIFWVCVFTGQLKEITNTLWLLFYIFEWSSTVQLFESEQ